MNTVLETKDLCKNFGGLKAMDSINLDIKDREIVALIGPNGAGKTTFFNCITGMHQPSKGEVIAIPPNKNKVSLKGKKPNKVTEIGLARTFQNIRLFGKMTVLQNVMVGRHCRTKNIFLEAIIRSPRFKKEERETVEFSQNLLETLGLIKFAHHLAENLPYAFQRRLEIARALATEPFLLLLDEPAAGMNPQETLALDRLILRIREEKKISILLIEHDMKLVMRISDRIFVMNQGKQIAQGTPAEIQTNRAVIQAYLGEG
jgi:branched-chain amino acid transport system ATP-binding protein